MGTGAFRCVLETGERETLWFESTFGRNCNLFKLKTGANVYKSTIDIRFSKTGQNPACYWVHHFIDSKGIL